jgi:hypothetical protein
MDEDPKWQRCSTCILLSYRISLNGPNAYLHSMVAEMLLMSASQLT